MFAPQNGEREKKRILSAMELRRAEVVLLARRKMLSLMLANPNRPITMANVRDAIEIPEGVDPRCMGAVPAALCDAGIIFADGYAKSHRPQDNSRVLVTWRLKSTFDAKRWLQEHPLPLPPATTIPTVQSSLGGKPRNQKMLFDDGGGNDPQ